MLARASGLADTGEQVWELWESVKREVRDIHVRLFYRPLLSAVAALPAEERVALDRAGARSPRRDRLRRPGRRPAAHRGAHERAEPQGDDPAPPHARDDPLVRRRRRPRLRPARLPAASASASAARPGSCGCCATRRARPRASRACCRARATSASSWSGSRSRPPGSTTESCSRPRSGVALQEEARAIQTRHATIDDAMRSVRALRRRELLRIAMAAILGTIDDRRGRRRRSPRSPR